MKILTFIFLFISTSVLFGQVKISVHSADTLPFTLFIDEVKLNNLPVTEIATLAWRPGKATIKVKIENSSYPEVSQPVTLRPNTQVNYELKLVKGVLKISPVSEVKFQMMEHTNFAPEASSTTTANTANENCVNLLSYEDFTALKSQLQQAHFEQQRFELLSASALAHCLRVEQLRFMLSKLEMEDNRLRLLEMSRDRIYDPSNAAYLEQEFFLEKNKSAARKIINREP